MMRNRTVKVDNHAVNGKIHSAFHSKIMLFGEYGIIKNSMGLSIPYADYTGKLSFKINSNDKSKAVSSNQALKSYLRYLWTLKKEGTLSFDFDLARFENDLYNGLYFDSSIPQGFGVGSSGALCAALYDHYVIDKVGRHRLIKEEMMALKKHLGQMESYYHGKSSGLDPLICYLNLPVLLKSKADISSINLPESKTGDGSIFLLDTGAPSETQPLVEWFTNKCQQRGFSNLFKENFVPFNDACINEFLKGETQALFQSLYHLSKFLFEHLKPMVPNLYLDVLKKGLDTGVFHLKLCGSGGGGYLLGFTEDMKTTKEMLSDYNIKEILKI